VETAQIVYIVARERDDKISSLATRELLLRCSRLTPQRPFAFACVCACVLLLIYIAVLF